MARQSRDPFKFDGVIDTPALNAPPQTYGVPTDLDAVRIIAYPYQLPAVDISSALISCEWNDSAEKAAQELQLTVYNVDAFAHKTLAPGTWLKMSLRHPATQLFSINTQFYVWERALTDAGRGTATVTALDIVSFLQRQGSRDWAFLPDQQHPYGWTASEVCKRVLDEFDIKYTLPKMTFRMEQLVLKKHTPFEAMVKALTRDRVGSGARWRIMAVGDTILIKRFLWQHDVWDFREGQNLISCEWTESLDDKKTEIVAHSVDRKGSNNIVRVYSNDIRRYGRIREDIYYDGRLKGKELEATAALRLKRIKNLKRTVKISAIGVPGVRASDAVTVVDSGTGLRGRFFATSVSHSISSSGYTMDIELSNLAVLAEEIPTIEETRPPNTHGGTVNNTSTGVSIVTPLGFGHTIKVIGESNVGEHKNKPQWISRCAIDIRASAGADVFASIDGTVVMIDRSKENVRTGHHCGISIIIRSLKSEFNIYYTGLENLPAEIVRGATVNIGTTKIGEVMGRTGAKVNFLHIATHVGDWKKFALTAASGCSSDPKKEFGLVPLNTDVPTADAPPPSSSNLPGPTGSVLDIPGQTVAYYVAAAKQYNIPWSILAAIGKVETDHGRSTLPGVKSGQNSAGAMGPMQFIKGTWDAFGVDADGDGNKNVYSLADAIYGAANYLSSNKMRANQPNTYHDAIYRYNHAEWYVTKVLAQAKLYQDAFAPDAGV